MQEFRSRHLLHLSLVSFSALSWSTSFLFLGGWWPAALYTLVLVGKEYLLHYFVIHRKMHKLSSVGVTLQVLLSALLLGECAYALGGGQALTAVGIILFFVLVTLLTSPGIKLTMLNRDYTGIIDHLLRIGYLVTVVYTVFFAGSKLGSQPFNLALLLSTLFVLMPFISTGRLSLGRKVSSEESRARLVLLYDLTWVVLGLVV